jgi:hypothetical protein
MKLPVSLALAILLTASHAESGPLTEGVKCAAVRLAAAEAAQPTLRDTARQSPPTRSPASRRNRKRNVLIGMAVGAAAGSITTVLHCQGKSASCNEMAPAFFWPMAGAGALVGALWP